MLSSLMIPITIRSLSKSMESFLNFTRIRFLPKDFVQFVGDAQKRGNA
jgi:hypothetical protein